MTTLQESNRSPHQVRSSPSNSSSIKSPSQLTTAHLVGGSCSSSPTRKRVHPNYLNIDDAVPPNKKINIPTKEEKASLLKEREMLYKKLAEEKRAPYYLTSQPVFPLLPLTNQFTTTITPNIYSLIQQQQQPQHMSSPPQVLPNNFIMSPSVPVNLSRVKLGPASLNTSTTLTANSTGSTSSLVGNTAGIAGLPTPGGSSVGTPPNPPYQSQLYPTSLLKFPFSPPTPSSFGLLSPWNLSNRSLGMNSSATTPGVPLSNEETLANSTDPSGMLQCLTGSCSSSESTTTSVPATSTPGNDEVQLRTSPSSRNLSSKEVPSQTLTHGQIQLGSISSSGSPQSVIMGLGSWPANSVGGAVPSPATLYQNTAHTQLKSLQAYTSLASIRSPLGLSPYSPANHVYSPYPGSVSSCPSVSSSSGCSSSSENQDNHMGVPKTYVLSEYHVGPHRMISEKDMDAQSEDTTNSGRNSPTELTAEECGTGIILPSDVAHRLSSEQYPSTVEDNRNHHTLNTNAGTKGHPLPNSGKKRHHSKHSGVGSGSPYPFSVESMGSSASPINTQQSYGAGCHLIDRPSSGVSSMSSSLSSRDSTPELEDLKHDSLLSSQGSQGSDVFCLVPGRLSLLSSTQKYKVMVDEVRRRLGHPECLNASVLGGILRRAKSKNGGTMLRQKLHEIGVSLPPGRRKQTEISLLTSLVENEALHLANDFHRLCDNLFPHVELAQIIARQHTGTPEAQHRISMVKASQLIVSELQQMIEAAGGPSNLRPSDPNNHYPGLTNFSLLTHSFGNPVINTCLGVLQTYLQELLGYYEGRRPIHLPERRYSTFENKPAQPLGGTGTAMGPESVPVPQGNPPQQNTMLLSNGVQKNPLLYATRHYPGGGRREGEEQENTPNSSSEVDVMVEVTLKEEPVDSPTAYTM